MLLEPFELTLPLGTIAIFLEGNHSFDTLLEVTDESGGKLGDVSQQPPPTPSPPEAGGSHLGL